MGVAEKLEVRRVARSNRYEIVLHHEGVKANLRQVGRKEAEKSVVKRYAVVIMTHFSKLSYYGSLIHSRLHNPMLQLTPSGQQTIQDIAQRHNFSVDAVRSMLESVWNGNGSMAQFSHPEFGGSGQWMQGGMTMIGDMFNNYLKGRVDNLCAELSRLVYNQPNNMFVPAPIVPDWWGAGLRFPNSSGGQNGTRYAWFSQARRLAMESNGQVIIYDTLDHQIGGVSQQQSGGSSVTFSSQYGYVDLSRLPIVSINGVPPVVPHNVNNNMNNIGSNPPFNPVNTTNTVNDAMSGDIFNSIEKLATLQARGILSQQEFAAKKAELLSRL